MTTPDSKRGRLALAAFAAALVALSAGAGTEVTQAQLPREFVVVAIGDSYAAGEGAPEVPGSFSYDTASRSWRGAPEVWTQGEGAAARRCHRSPRSGFARAIARLRDAVGPRGVTVTFRSFACAGAGVRFSIDPKTGALSNPPVGGGLLFSYEGVPGERGTATSVFSPQMKQAREFLESTGRRADAILLNVGGNDFGFAHLILLCAVAEYLVDPNSVPSGLTDCQNNPITGGLLRSLSVPTIVSAAQAILREGTLRSCAFMAPQAVVTRICRPMLRASYDLLGAALEGFAPRTYMRCSPAQELIAESRQFLSAVGTVQTVNGIVCTKRAPTSPANPAGVWSRIDRSYPSLAARSSVGGLAASGSVLITTLPDPLTDDSGAPCDRGPVDDRATRQVTAAESTHLRGVVRPALNAEVVGAASRHGWTVVSAASPVGHGVCASADERWFNTNRDSLASQGEDVESVSRLGSDSEPALSGGFVHPNAEGYRNIYAGVATALRARICQRFSLSPCPVLAG